MVEPSLGADRVTLAFLVDAYDEEVVDAEKNLSLIHISERLWPEDQAAQGRREGVR